MLPQWQPQHRFLYSFDGFRYCDLLLDLGDAKEVKRRAALSLKIATTYNWILIMALDNPSLGRAWFLEAQQSGTFDTDQAASFLQRAVDGLREAGAMAFIAFGLLARAELYRFGGDHDRAERDLAEVLRIATRSGMGFYLADYHLGTARIRLAQGDKEKTREHLATAKEMIERMGYHRRDKEVDEIAQHLGS